MRKRTRKILIILAIIAVAGWVALYFLKSWMLDIAIGKVQTRLKNEHQIALTIKSHTLNGWKEVQLEGIMCKNSKNDTLVYLGHMQAVVRLWPLLSGKIRLEKLVAEKGMMDVALLKELRKKKHEPEEPRDSSKLARARKYLSYVKEMADMVPDHVMIRQINLKYHTANGYIDSASLIDNKIAAKTNLTIRGQRQDWNASGSFDQRSLETHLNVQSSVTGFYDFAFLRKLAKAEVGFKSYHIDINQVNDNSDNLYLKGAVSAENVLLYNPKLSTDTISLKKGGLDFGIKLTEQNLQIDTTSRIHLNDLVAMFSADYKYAYPANILARLELAPVPAQNIIDAMPGGAFETAKTIRLQGDMGYHLNFYLNLDTKDSIKIDAAVLNQGIKITDYGKSQLNKINGAFTYYPYNSHRPIRVDSAAAYYTPLHSIPKQLVDAVIASEDPGFYGHHGIEPSAIESSFLKDFQKGSFRQGGSTITMQLVKNVFLSHKKTIDRKLEEFFLVWLLENCHVTSKNRILEVYLNIIEWGPDVYGIGEASHFYFNKPPSELNLNECIFLAKIIPQPLGFMNRFDETGKLKENFQRKVLNTVDRMTRRGKLDEETQGSYWPEVQITGPAKKLIRISDSTRVQDSLRRENDW